MSRRLALAALLLSLAPPARAPADPGAEFFEKKVRPVLAAHCYECHSAQAAKLRAGLLLDSRGAILAGGESGPAVVPGQPGESRLIRAVRYADPHLRMPPRGKLPDHVVADLEKWVALGAPAPEGEAAAAPRAGSIDLEAGRQFWAFRPPQDHPAPPVKDAAWPRTPIDRFILAKLEENGLSPAPDADRVTLIRRAYFDLIGLPPTPEQIDAFAGDPAPLPEAFAKVVDKLLASPHFGERWGRHWLDVARFAESTGGGRSLLLPDAWRYRDYVIRSFNEDKPFDRFVKEQLAGDLLPPGGSLQDERDRLVATAFLALGPTNYERQDKDVLEMDVIDEQLDTIGKAFLGMTVGCARCHDHKFDPIPTADYYALAGIFKSTQTMIHDNVSRWVDRPLPVPPEQQAAIDAHEKSVAALREKIKKAKAALAKAGRKLGPVPVKGLPGIVIDDPDAKRVGEWVHSTYSGVYIGAGYLHDGAKDKGQKTLTFVPNFPEAGHYEVRLAYTPGGNRSPRVPVTILHADGETLVHVNLQGPPPIDDHWVSLGRFRFEKTGQNFVMVSNEDTTGHVVIDAVQFLADSPSPPVAKGGVATAAARENPPRAGKGVTAADVKRMEAELKKLQASGPPRPMTMSVREAEQVGDCRVCIRGNFHNQGEKVPRGFLRVATVGEAPEIPAGQSGRLQLAEWVASGRNPLTARVFVNRVWHHLFGRGLVRTVDNFGSTGEPPSHPELLDHLAVRFVREGWSVKKLVREVVLSRVYQLASRPQPKDPENRLFSYMARRRLDAEATRDAILAVSGRLDRTVGGPTVRPGTTTEYGYRFDDTRRSVYTPVFRNQLLELFEAFDFPDPNTVGGRRNVSTVATQALFLMNSPFVIGEARHAADAALAVPGLDDAGRVERAYRTALGRLPTPRERELALEFVGRAATSEERRDAWARFYQALFACIDFRYLH